MTLIGDIWASFRRLPVWVQIWVGVILVPVNMASLAFLFERDGGIVAILAIGGLLPNLFLMIKQRGLSKAMALSHVLVWMPMIFWILLRMIGGFSDGFMTYLIVLIIIDAISLLFDISDAVKWLRGNRAVA